MSEPQEIARAAGDRGHLTTEQTNPASANLDELSPLELVDLFNQEDIRTVEAIAGSRVGLAKTVKFAAQSLKQGGRLFYIGAGTSGRLGVLDASECPPTFCTDPEMVQGIIAGGRDALVRSSEALEDNANDGANALKERSITAQDTVVGITAGGTTPYVHGALKFAQTVGAKTAFIACVPQEQVAPPGPVDADIRLMVGPELLTGSTRLKSGTATKMALNIISTGAMVLLGKVYGNRMVDVSVSNTKLRDRAVRMICDLADVERNAAQDLLNKADSKVKLALLMHWTGLNKNDAQELLDQQHGDLRGAIAKSNQSA